MIGLFRALSERVKSLFVTTVALDFEADFLARDAERRADLLRQADRYEAEGLHGIAEHVRRRAEAMSLQQPLASVLPAVEHLSESHPHSATPLISATEKMPDIVRLPASTPRTQKKGK